MPVGLVFCAGYGKRLGDLTKETPKCMIDVCGKPVLERIIDHFHSHDIQKIIVNTHWLPIKIMEYFQNEVLFTFEPELLGEYQTIEGLRRWLADDYVVVANGDTLSDVDLGLMLELSAETNSNIRFSTKDVYAGYAVLHPDYFKGNKKFNDYFSDAFWVDMGTPEGLAEARRIYT